MPGGHGATGIAPHARAPLGPSAGARATGPVTVQQGNRAAGWPVAAPPSCRDRVQLRACRPLPALVLTLAAHRDDCRSSPPTDSDCRIVPKAPTALMAAEPSAVEAPRDVQRDRVTDQPSLLTLAADSAVDCLRPAQYPEPILRERRSKAPGKAARGTRGLRHRNTNVRGEWGEAGGRVRRWARRSVCSAWLTQCGFGRHGACCACKCGHCPRRV